MSSSKQKNFYQVIWFIFTSFIAASCKNLGNQKKMRVDLCLQRIQFQDRRNILVLNRLILSKHTKLSPMNIKESKKHVNIATAENKTIGFKFYGL